MKKWKILLILSVLTFVLAACGSKTETVTLKSDLAGFNTEIVYIAENDKIIKQTTKTVMNYADLEISSKEEAEEFFGEFIDAFQDMDGIDHKMEYKDDSAIEELTMDYEKLDKEILSALPGAGSDGDMKEVISLKETVKVLEEQGFEVVK